MDTLNVVLPVRISEDRLDLLDRLAYFMLDTEIPDTISFTVIDDGSNASSSFLIQQKCMELNINYHKIDSEKDHFSVGRVRNVAAQLTDAKYIMFQDVDLMPYNGFYQHALNECYIQKLDKYADRFIMFSVVYLTEEASKEFLDTPESFRKNLFLNYLFENNKEKIEKFSTGTSVTIWRRDHYLCTGGNDPDFEGWGFEDLEYACRAIRRNRKFPLPNQFNLDYRNFMSIQEYKGWKSIYRLYGDITFQKGIVLFHKWHPVDNKSSYIKQKENNKKIFESKLAQFAKDRTEPKPLPRLSKGKSLLFRSNPWTLNRWIAPNLGEVLVIDEDRFDSQLLIDFIYENEISRVVFHNPYANDKLIELYNTVKTYNIPYLVCERGALRDSVFLDPNGFNADSKSYHPDYWNHDLSDEHRNATIEYIRNEKSSHESLEHQNKKLSKSELRKALGISEGKKILFVPLQRPSDTVIKYFSGAIGSFDNFISMVAGLAYALPRNWKIVVKKHPLEIETPKIEGVYYADEQNIKALIELSDAVLLINSGVGVLSMLYGKPTLVAGSAFYAHPDITYHVQNTNDVLNGLSFKPDNEKILRFLSYLINNFYSFGTFKTRIVDWIDGSKMSATSEINYYCVRFPNEPEMILECSTVPQITSSSLLFDRYRDPNNNIRLGDTVPDTKKPALPPVKQTSLSNTINNSSTEIVGKDIPLTPSRFTKKLNKFKNNPGLFLRDSKSPVLKMLGKFIK